MSWLDKAKALASDPENQRKAKEALRKAQAKRKHRSHGSHHHGGGLFEDHDEEFDQDFESDDDWDEEDYEEYEGEDE